MFRSVPQWCLIGFLLLCGATAQAQLQANLGVTKSGPPLALPDTDVPYVVTVTNAGPDAATSVTLTDQIPADMTFESATQDSGPPFNCSDPGEGNTGTVICTIAALLPGASAQFTFTFEIDDDVIAGTPFANTATVSSSTPDPNTANNSATATTRAPAADLTVTKSGPATATAGSNVSYVVTMTNLGPDAATDATITDNIPPGMTFVSFAQNSGPGGSCTDPGAGFGGMVVCTIASLPAGASAQFTFVFNIPGDTPPGTFFTNVATVSTEVIVDDPDEPVDLDPNEENDSAFATTSTPPPPQADLAVTKTGPAGAAPNTDVTFTIVLTNSGPDPATTVKVTDPLPGTMTFVSLGQSGQPLSCTTPAAGSTGTITCTAETYPAGASTTLTLTGHVPAGTARGTEFTNTATVTSDSDPNVENNIGTTTVTISAVDVSVVKAGPPSAVAGSTVTYGLTVTNAGPDQAFTVVLSDQLPAGTTFVSFAQTSGPAASCETPPAGTNGVVICTIGVLDVNQSAVFSLVIRTAPGAASVTNTAAVQTDSFDTDNTDNQSTVVTPLAFESNLGVTKTGPATVTAGTNATYTITVTNTGPSNAPNVTLTDTPSANLTFVSATQSSGPAFNCSGLPSSPCTISSLAVNATATFTFVFAVSSSATGTTTNTATIASGATDPTPANNTSTVNSTVATSADVAVTKSGPATVTAGTTVTYTVTVTNNGPSDAANVVLTDTLPANTTFVSRVQSSGPVFTCTQPGAGSHGTITCSIAALARSATAVFTFVFAVAPDATGPMSNTAGVSTSTADPVASNNTSTVASTIGSSADLSVTKTGPSTATAGSNVTYDVTVTNIGPSTAVNVTLTDAVPAGTTFVSAMQTGGPTFACNNTITCTIASFAPGAQATFTFVFAVSPATTGSINNTASVSSQTADPVASNNSSTVATTAGGSADLGVTKTGTTAVTAGTNASYDVTVTNAGPSTAVNVTLTDTVPAGTTFVSATQTSGPAFTCNTAVTCTIASFAPGAQATFTFVFNVSPGTTASFNNTAGVTSQTTDPVASNNTSTVTTTVSSSADLGVTKSGPASVLAGTNASYTVTVTNAGPSTAVNVTLTDAVPAGTTFVSANQTGGPAFTCNSAITCTIASFAPGAQATFTFVFNVSPGTTASFNNTAGVTSQTADPVASNNTSTVTTTVSSSADLGVTKSGPASVLAGTNASYTVTVTNAGPSTAVDVTLTDAVPAGTTFVSANQTGGPAFTCNSAITCTIASFAPGAQATFTFVFNVSSGTTAPINNTATVSSPTPDVSSANNTATVTTNTSSNADVAVTKSGPAMATAGTNATYTVTVTNAGPSTAVNVTLTDAVPAGTTFVSANQTGGPTFTCDNSITCTIASFAPGAQATFTFVFNVSSGTTAPINNTATVSSPTPDVSSANNTATVTTNIGSTADLAVTKTGPAVVTAGSNVTYTVTLTNGGPSTANNVTLTDFIPGGTSFVSANQPSGPAFTCTASSDRITCTAASLAPAAQATFDFVFNVAPTTSGSIENTAAVTTTTSDPNAANNTSIVTSGINPGPVDLSITKTANVDRAGFGAPVTYTITVTNNGPSTAFATTVTDVLPAGTTFQSATPSQGTCTGTTTVVCNLGTLAPAATATISLTVMVPASAGTVSNTATVSAANAETSPGNNASTAAIAVTTEIPSLSVSALALLAMALAAAAVMMMRSQ